MPTWVYENEHNLCDIVRDFRGRLAVGPDQLQRKFNFKLWFRILNTLLNIAVSYYFYIMIKIFLLRTSFKTHLAAYLS